MIKLARSSRGLPTADTDAEPLWRELQRDAADDTAFLKLMEHYLPLVARIVRQESIRIAGMVDPREMLSSGVLGLHAAIRRYTPQRGVPFTSFAAPRIRGAILDDLRRRDRLTRPQRNAVRRLRAGIEEFTRVHGRAPEDEELARFVGFTSQELAQAQSLAAEPATLDATVSERSDERALWNLPDDRGPTPEQAADRVFGLEALREAVCRLPVRDQQLLFLRYHEDLTVTEIAQAFGVTPGRVSQMYNGAVLKLRALMKVEDVTTASARAR